MLCYLAYNAHGQKKEATMHRRISAATATTPCPAPIFTTAAAFSNTNNFHYSHTRRDNNNSLFDDADADATVANATATITADVEFTRALNTSSNLNQNLLTAVKPRRRQTQTQTQTTFKTNRRDGGVEVVIHEDARSAEDGPPPRKDIDHHDAELRNTGLGGGGGGGGLLLARPAKRLRGRVSFVGGGGRLRDNGGVGGDRMRIHQQQQQYWRVPLGRIAEVEIGVADMNIAVESVDEAMQTRPQPLPRRRVSSVGPGILKKDRDDTTMNLTWKNREVVVVQEGNRKMELAKPPRRGTIYIPPDDTTMPSMYMGIFSPVKEMGAGMGMEKVVESAEDGGMGQAQGQTSILGIGAEMAKRRGRRVSLAAEPARRVGLLRSVLGTVREQEPSSKLNVSQDLDQVGAATGKENLPPGFSRRVSTFDAKCRQDERPFSKTAAHYARPVQRRQTVFGAFVSTNARPQPEQRKPVWNSGATMKPPKVHTYAPKQILPRQNSPKASKVPTPPPTVPSRFVQPRVHQEEQLSQHFPPLHEDINNPAMYEDSWLTHQEIAITQLLNNLFSSASSQEPIDQDLLRLDLLDLYQSSKFVLLHKRLHGAILYGALRVPENLLVHAKRLQNDLGIRRAFIDLWTRTYERVALKTALEVVVGRQCPNALKDVRTFIEVFLIRNEDGCPDADCTDHVAWSYRRTILRSLMLIQLLDHAKTMKNSILTTSLFLTSSQHKTSTEVLHALTQLLNPSMGQRALAHLEYTLEHKQHPLEEFSYPVGNLAIDLRDGVRLTRLVELLLYPSASTQLARESTDDTVMTLNMPTGEVLSMLDIDSPTKKTQYPLSQHLKFPCEGRAVKLFNVQITLTALQQVKSMRTIVQDISAEDIVDGFREKTVALLWGLTGKWGLGGLIDWKDVRSEISRFQRKRAAIDDDDNSDFLDEDDLEDLSNSFTGYKALLKAWAGGVAASKGLKVKNLTTSFADGRVFEAIVDEYERYLPAAGAADDNPSSPGAKVKKALHDRLVRLGCSAQFSSLFASSSNPTSSSSGGQIHHINNNNGGKGATKYLIFDRDFTLAALAFLCSRLLSATKRARASTVIQRCWRGYALKDEARRKKVARMLAGQCAEVVRVQEGILRGEYLERERSGRVVWRAWVKSRDGKKNRNREGRKEGAMGKGMEGGMVDDEHENDTHEETKLELDVAPGDLWLDL